MSEEYATKVMSASATYANITMTALMQKSNSIIAPPIREIYASIHPFNRKQEWQHHRKLHQDWCPTVVANEFRSVGNVIWEVYE